MFRVYLDLAVAIASDVGTNALKNLSARKDPNLQSFGSDYVFICSQRESTSSARKILRTVGAIL